MIVVSTESAEETQAFAGALARALAGEVRSGRLEAVLVGLTGELGAGKTTFVRGFVAALAPERAREVTSPTFAIAQTYRTDPPVRHLDLYRLDSLADLEAIGYRDLYFGPGGITLVEWIDRVPEAVPAGVEWLEIRLAVREADGRELALEARGERLAGVLDQLRSTITTGSGG